MKQWNVQEMYDELHQIPELGFEEVKTSHYVAQRLQDLGYEVTTGLGKTGVVGVLRGQQPGPVLMLRADMDALPFKNDDGTIERIHACGHDAHTAMLLSAAQQLVGKVQRGTLKVLFQPAEETLYGAQAVIADGVIDDVDIAFGLHVRPVQDCPLGKMVAAVRHTSSTFVRIELKGRAVHASRPHLGVNCAEAAALVTSAICALKFNPALAWSCKVTSIDARAAATNIIPDSAVLMLDVRAQTNELMAEMLERIRAAADGAAAALGATATTTTPGPVIPAAVYDEELLEDVRESIVRLFGADCLSKDCGGGGEDFHFFKQHKPELKVAYFGVGAGCTPSLHARNMQLDSSQLHMGVKVLVDLTLKKLG